MLRMGLKNEGVPAHGFRATASTLLNECSKSLPTLSKGPWPTKTRITFAAHMPEELSGLMASRSRKGGLTISAGSMRAEGFRSIVRALFRKLRVLGCNWLNCFHC